MMELNRCPLCGNEPERAEYVGNSNTAAVRCDTCGAFTLSFEAWCNLRSLSDDRRGRLMIATRQHRDSTGEPLPLDSGRLEETADATRVRNPAEALIPLLRLAQKKAGPTHGSFELNPKTDHPAIGLLGPERMEDLLFDARQRNLLRLDENRASDIRVFSLTLGGYELLNELNRAARSATGWSKVDQQREGMEAALTSAEETVDFQTVGLHARDSLLTLAQAVFRKEEHPSIDGVEIGPADAERMLAAYFQAKLKDASTEARGLVKAAKAFANTVTHKRSATRQDAAMAAEAFRSLVEYVAILEGKRG